MAVEDSKVITINERTHPLYDKYLEEWNFYIESALGGKDYYENDGNLFTHRLEDQSGDYNDRLSRVYYLNFCNLVCSIYADYIFKEKIRRPPNTNLDSFRHNVDGRGTDINTFMNQVSYLSSVYGQIHIIVDSPYAEDLNIPLHFYKANKAQFDPYAVIVAPQDLRDWSVDELGNLNWVLIRSRGYSDSDPTSPREDDTTYRLIARDYWATFDSDGNELERREHSFGEVYMTTCYNSDTNIDMIGESLITDISRINRIIYNWCSNIDEMIERQTFSQLVMPDDPQSDLDPRDESADPLRKVSTSSIFTFPFNSSQPPQFISPDRQQIDVIWKMIQNHRDLIYELAGLGTVGSSSKFLSQRCVVGDTLVDVVRNTEKYPKGIPIKDLVGKEGLLAYTYNFDTERIEIKPVKAVAKTRENAEVWELKYKYYDQGEEVESVLKATPDHKILLRNGKYKCLRDLKAGDSLMPLNRFVTDQGYPAFFAPGWGYITEHRLIGNCGFLNREYNKGDHIHHKDYNKLNNEIANLLVCTKDEHSDIHFVEDNPTYYPEVRGKIAESNRRYYESLDERGKKAWREKSKKGARRAGRAIKSLWSNMSDKERHRRSKILSKAQNRISKETSERMKEYWASLSEEEKAQRNKNNSKGVKAWWDSKSDDYKKEWGRKKSKQNSGKRSSCWKEITADEILHAISATADRGTYKAVAEFLGISLPTLKKKMVLNSVCWSPNSNHEVVSVRFVGYEDTYNMEVVDTHNFIANDIVIANSGISQAYQFLSINSSLAKKATRLERAENEINRLVLQWKSQNDMEEKVEYPSQFDVLSLTETMQTTFQIAAQNFSETLNIELLKALAKKAAPVLPEDILNDIYKEIEENSGVLMSPALALGPGFGGAFGGGFSSPDEEGLEEEE